MVKAIYGAKVPVITAIGHETDTTLADYAADVRAATPTHAAEMAFFDVREAELDLAALADRAYERVMACIEDRQRLVEQAAGRLNLKRYDAFLAMKETHLSGLMQQADRQLQLQLEQKQGKLNTLTASLQALNPAALVRRGYGQLMQQGKILTDIHSVSQDSPLTIQVVDGTITTAVKEVDIYGKND